MFYDPKLFPFVEYLESHAETIRREVGQLSAKDFSGWDGAGTIEKPTRWTVLVFYTGLEEGEPVQPVEKNCALCPETVEIVDRIQGLRSAAISRLEAGKWVKPHVDPRKVLRCHLGISIPEECGIRSGGQFRRWEEDKCLVMDATFVHEAWNRSDSDRLVLVVDVDPLAVDIDLGSSFERSSLGNQAAKAIQQVHYMARKSVTGVSKRLSR